MRPILLVHGGSGKVAKKLIGLKTAIRSGYKRLKDGSSLDAVETAVRCMECAPVFNAGFGSCLNCKGQVELDASIMEGKHLRAGCVALLRNIKNPVSVARRVMDETDHTFLSGENCLAFARSQNFKILPSGALISEDAKEALKEYEDWKAKGIDITGLQPEAWGKLRSELGESVGAVAIDENGNIAAATSSGGTIAKMSGRVGDVPILGGAVYADNLIGGISITGHGEKIMRYNTAQRIMQLMYLNKISVQEATENAFKEMEQRLCGTGGAIVMNKKGEIGVYSSTKNLSWGYAKDNWLYCSVNNKLLKDFV